MTDDELRNAIRKEMNGPYATKICRNCKHFRADMTGRLATATIVNRCPLCPWEGEPWEDEQAEQLPSTK